MSVVSEYIRHQFRFHRYLYDIDVSDKGVVVWMPIGVSGYLFPLDKNLVLWGKYPEYAALVPQEVMQYVEDLVQNETSR